MTRRTLLLTAVLAPGLGLLPSAAAAPSPPSEATVVLKDSTLSFEARTVVVQLDRRGLATVTWRWDTASVRPHSVQEDSGAFDSHPGCGDSGFYGLGTGVARCGYTAATTFTHTFRRAGTYRYHCAVHGSPGQGMAGTVIVKGPPTPRKR